MSAELTPKRGPGRPRKSAQAPKPEGPSPSPAAPAEGDVQRGFAERLRRVFDASGMTHAEFATRSGLPKGALSVILKRAQDPARMGPSIVTVVALARGLGVSPGWLAFGEGPAPAGALRAAKEPAIADEHLARDTEE